MGILNHQRNGILNHQRNQILNHRIKIKNGTLRRNMTIKKIKNGIINGIIKEIKNGAVQRNGTRRNGIKMIKNGIRKNGIPRSGTAKNGMLQRKVMIKRIHGQREEMIKKIKNGPVRVQRKEEMTKNGNLHHQRNQILNHRIKAKNGTLRRNMMIKKIHGIKERMIGIKVKNGIINGIIKDIKNGAVQRNGTRRNGIKMIKKWDSKKWDSKKWDAAKKG